MKKQNTNLLAGMSTRESIQSALTTAETAQQKIREADEAIAAALENIRRVASELAPPSRDLSARVEAARLAREMLRPPPSQHSK